MPIEPARWVPVALPSGRVDVGCGDAQQWELLSRPGLALGLSTVIGLEREWRQKSAGLQMYTLVGLGSALFLLVSVLSVRAVDAEQG